MGNAKSSLVTSDEIVANISKRASLKDEASEGLHMVMSFTVEQVTVVTMILGKRR